MKPYETGEQVNQPHLTDESLYQMRYEAFNYDGPLGAIYQKEATEFRLWAPTAVKVELVIYQGYYGPIGDIYEMDAKESGRYYSVTLEGDQHGTCYLYRVSFADGRSHDAVDPYAKATTVNGRRTVVVDLARTNPSNWERLPAFEDPTQTLIYELHIRDFTIDPQAGYVYPGKYLALTEKGLRNQAGQPIGIDYLQSLGVTHVQIMPFFDFATVDETPSQTYQYNWGYDPLNYNVPEGSYATDAYDPFTRIKELKRMIKALHEAGIRVIMDVVYNHVYQLEQHSFEQLVPGYYFRKRPDGSLSNGTGVGNDTASEHFMMRKYIVDSVTYWAREYHLDGFRFDLMGIHDVTTMQQVRAGLDEIDPSIIILGEGWDLPTSLSSQKKASQANALSLPGIAFFNDELRNALRGHDFEAKTKGYITGAWYQEPLIAQEFLANALAPTYLSPLQLIQYVEVHDNLTLYDKIRGIYRDESKEMVVSRQEFALSLILLAQGIPFIHAGSEFLRSKQGIRNTYNQPDQINQIDWQRQIHYQHTVKLVRQLIQLRRQEPLLRMKSYETIRQQSQIYKTDYQIIELTLANQCETLWIVFNGQTNEIDVCLPEGDYLIKLLGGQVYLADDQSTGLITHIHVPALSALVLKQYK